MDFSNSIIIDRSIRDVFDYVSDLENVPRWNYAIVETKKITDGPIGVGAIFRQVRSLPRRSEEMLQITEFEPDRRFAVHGDLGPFSGTLTYDFQDLGASTRLTNEATLEAQGVMRLAAPIAAGRVRDAVAKNLGALKAFLESSQSS
jgi:carbon monoxide dehydrogenase subunit G